MMSLMIIRLKAPSDNTTFWMITRRQRTDPIRAGSATSNHCSELELVDYHHTGDNKTKAVLAHPTRSGVCVILPPSFGQNPDTALSLYTSPISTLCSLGDCLHSAKKQKRPIQAGQ